MRIEFDRGGKYATTLEEECIDYRGILWVIPIGFRFDGASIPWWAWSLTKLHPWHERVRRAAKWHDYLYSKGFKVLADKMFKSLLKEDGCNKYQYMVCYWAVRLFGGRRREQ